MFFSCVCLGGSSSRSAPRKTKKRARRTLRPVVSDDEEEVVIPTKPTRREKSAAVKRVIMPLHRWKAKDWEAFRSKNQYEVAIAPRWTTVQFRNEMQVRIVHELFEHNKNRYAK